MGAGNAKGSAVEPEQQFNVLADNSANTTLIDHLVAVSDIEILSPKIPIACNNSSSVECLTANASAPVILKPDIRLIIDRCESNNDFALTPNLKHIGTLQKHKADVELENSNIDLNIERLNRQLAFLDDMASTAVETDIEMLQTLVRLPVSSKHDISYIAASTEAGLLFLDHIDRISRRLSLSSDELYFKLKFGTFDADLNDGGKTKNYLNNGIMTLCQLIEARDVMIARSKLNSIAGCYHHYH